MPRSLSYERTVLACVNRMESDIGKLTNRYVWA